MCCKALCSGLAVASASVKVCTDPSAPAGVVCIGVELCYAVLKQKRVGESRECNMVRGDSDGAKGVQIRPKRGQDQWQPCTPNPIPFQAQICHYVSTQFLPGILLSRSQV